MKSINNDDIKRALNHWLKDYPALIEAIELELNLIPLEKADNYRKVMKI